jgi:hypothetical protein
MQPKKEYLCVHHGANKSQNEEMQANGLVLAHAALYKSVLHCITC